MPAGDVMLRRWRLDDLDSLHSAVVSSIDHLRPYMAWAADGDVAGQRSYLEATVPAWESDERYEFAIVDPRAGIIGSAGLLARIGAGGLEIGYWVHADHTGRGVATMSAGALTAAAFSLPWVDRIEIHHDETNRASGAVPARLGFQMIARAARLPAAPSDSGHDLIWRLRREEYRAGKGRAETHSAT